MNSPFSNLSIDIDSSTSTILPNLFNSESSYLCCLLILVIPKPPEPKKNKFDKFGGTG